jgi:hypothetical protein
MKKLFLIIAAVSFFTVSCEMLDKLTQFNLNYDTSFDIPSQEGLDTPIPIDITTPDINTDSEATFEGKSTAKNLVEEIVLKNISLVITSPDEQTFDFLKSIEVYLIADGLAEVKIASDDNVEDGLTELVLDIDNTDLKEYIFANTIKLRLNITPDEIVTTETSIDINSTFFVDAKILGI